MTSETYSAGQTFAALAALGTMDLVHLLGPEGLLSLKVGTVLVCMVLMALLCFNIGDANEELKSQHS